MAISFQKIPPNIRVPLSYFELDPSQAATQQQQLQLALMLGAVATGTGATVPVNKPFLVRSADDARGIFGAGTALARMAAAFFRNNTTVPLYALCAANTTFDEAEGTMATTGAATASGTIWLYIGGVLGAPQRGERTDRGAGHGGAGSDDQQHAGGGRYRRRRNHAGRDDRAHRQ